MSAPQQTPDEFAQEMIDFAGRRLAEGIAPAEVEKELIHQGVECDAAHMVVQGIQTVRRRAAARSKLLFGVLGCVIGLLVAILTMQGAEEAGGGKFLAAFLGVLLFGGIELIRGFTRPSGE